MLLNYKVKGSDWQILGFQMLVKILNKLILNISAILYLKLTIKIAMSAIIERTKCYVL